MFPRNFCTLITLPTPHLQHCRSEAAMVTGPAPPGVLFCSQFLAVCSQEFCWFIDFYPFLPARFIPELEIQFVTFIIFPLEMICDQSTTEMRNGSSGIGKVDLKMYILASTA